MGNAKSGLSTGFKASRKATAIKRLQEESERFTRGMDVIRLERIDLLRSEKYAAKSIMEAYGVKSAVDLIATPATRAEQQFVRRALSRKMDLQDQEPLFKISDLPEYLQDAFYRGWMRMEYEEEMRRLRI